MPRRVRNAAGAAVVLLLAAAAPAQASTITVNDTGDTAANDGDCVLREAITSANTNAASGAMAGECVAGQASPTEDLIEFDIAGAGPHVIAPTTDLPDITQVVTVDGSTDGTDEIALDGDPNSLGFGLRVGGGSTVDSLSIYGFGTGVLVDEPNGTVLNSFLGTNEAGAAGIGNSTGVSLSAANGVARGNVISGNQSTGISVFSSGASVAGNRIGTTPAGTTALANGGSGVVVHPSADSATIGGPALADGNLISGNTGTGISASEVGSAVNAITGLVIQGNRIGTGIGGEASVPNTGDGVLISGNVSGATVADNLISGNGSEGITLATNVVQPVGAPGPSQNVVSGNLIGTDDDGEAVIPNGAEGVSVGGNADHPSTGNTIGGTTGLTPGGSCTGDCNLISGSPGDGIELNGVVEETEVLGNFVGTDVTGAADLGNAFDGVLLNGATESQIGSPAAPNRVSGNGSDGISVTNASADNVVQSNLVGADVFGGALGNDANGILVNGTGTDRNFVGGPGVGEGNLIVGNDLDGVRVSFGPVDNPILGNTIAENGELGIDIGPDGVTPNDAGDADTGENDLQNFPELTAVAIGGSTVVKGALDSTASSDFRIEVFGNDGGDPSSHGEAFVSLGAFDVTTDGNGDAEFTEVLDGTAADDGLVSATATELGPLGELRSTSELALNLEEGTCDVEGTDGDDPALAGTSADEVICGFEGDDVIDGGGGDDVIVGGDGTDEVDYSAAAAEIDADLEAGTITGPGAGSDLVADIEDVRGSDFDDVITGDAVANFVFAGAGKDTITGGDGDDELKGSDGGDTLKGGDGADELLAQDGGDTLRGQSGDDDDLSGGPGKDNLNGGGGTGDHCNGGGNDDDTPANGCETTSSIP